MKHRRPGDLPRAELEARGNKALSEHPGARVWFKFTCERCGERCTFIEPNTLYERGVCHVCGHDQPVTEGGFALEIPLR